MRTIFAVVPVAVAVHIMGDHEIVSCVKQFASARLWRTREPQRGEFSLTMPTQCGVREPGSGCFALAGAAFFAGGR